MLDYATHLYKMVLKVMGSQSSSILCMAFSRLNSLLAPALMASMSSMNGSRLNLSIFRREVPESGVMLSPVSVHIFSQCRGRSPGLQRTWMRGRYSCRGGQRECTVPQVSTVYLRHSRNVIPLHPIAPKYA